MIKLTNNPRKIREPLTLDVEETRVLDDAEMRRAS